VFAQLLGATGYFLQAVLMWRLIKWRAWRHFPVFFYYYLFLLARQALNTYFEGRFGSYSMFFARWYWYSSIVSDILKLLVAWEIYRKVFQPGSAAQRFAGSLLAGTLVLLSAFYSLGRAHETNFFVAVGLNASFAVAVWIIGVLVLVQYYRIPMSRNVWGIALGLGLFSATAIVNYSTLGLNEKAFPVYGYVRAISFVTSLFVWTWSLWSYRPLPRITPPAPPAASTGSREPLEATAEAVGQALGLRKF
jgi:hypothetical protein